MLKVTLDTNAVEQRTHARIAEACGAAGVPVEIVQTSVTARELEGSSIDAPGPLILETAVFGESRYGQAVYGSELDAERYEEILRVIGHGSFPPRGKRDSLTRGQRRQLRDAIILSARSREGRAVFVTDDKRAFISHGKREALEAICGTRIRIADEFVESVSRLYGSRYVRTELEP